MIPTFAGAIVETGLTHAALKVSSENRQMNKRRKISKALSQLGF
jgi:hypothetical protein